MGNVNKQVKDEFPLDEWIQMMDLRKTLERLVSSKGLLIDLSLACLVSGGHLLIEDVPGVGKSTFIKALAKLADLLVGRIQCTSDMLPSDLIGAEIFDPIKREFIFHKGPIFAELVFIDELNRAPPRTQSALLEAMGEGQVSVDKKTYLLPPNFNVFATQNSSEQYGTFPLPESQLDRFSAKVRFGYPSSQHEMELFKNSKANPLDKIGQNVIKKQSIQQLALFTEKIFISEDVAAYAKKVVDATRKHPQIAVGVSTRGGISWVRMAKAIALLKERTYVIPDDLQYIGLSCLAHRIVCHQSGQNETLIQEILRDIEV